jgi:hypothetical protein
MAYLSADRIAGRPATVGVRTHATEETPQRSKFASNMRFRALNTCLGAGRRLARFLRAAEPAPPWHLPPIR